MGEIDNKYSYFLIYDAPDMHYQVWEKDDLKKAVNIVMRFTNKEQAIDHYKNLGIKLLIDIQ